ncbi:phosphatase PAP2 family protein [Nonomuraea thailandensis]
MIAGPAGIVGAYVVSEVVKLVVREDRPCRGGVATIAACPPTGDWSFPSNHSVIAAGAAATLVLVWRGLAWLVFPLAAVMAFSRVFVGVHYPHDVAAGFLLGVVLAPLFTLLLVGAVTPAVRLMRARLAGEGTAHLPSAQPFTRPFTQPAAQPSARPSTRPSAQPPARPVAESPGRPDGHVPSPYFGQAAGPAHGGEPGPGFGQEPNRSVASMSRSRMPGSE